VNGLCDIGDPALRTRDAFHLASALLLGEGVMALVAYDNRLADAARAVGLGVAAPGQVRPAPAVGSAAGVAGRRRWV
jgi:hypothetical protein